MLAVAALDRRIHQPGLFAGQNLDSPNCAVYSRRVAGEPMLLRALAERIQGVTFGRLTRPNSPGATRRHLRRRLGGGGATGTPMLDRSQQRTAAQQLAEFAVGLSFENIPAAVAKQAKVCLIDAVACAVFGQKLPWSQMVLAEALASGAGGPCRLPGAPEKRLHVPQAALAFGTFAHAFELDNLRQPASGVHGGATVALPALAMAQAVGASGRDLIKAIVAGVEVMFRIGNATLHSAETVGFHAPGMTGPFGSAAACASLLRLTAAQTANAFGIAGSLGGGVLAFAKAHSGGMIKRLHLGRAAEAGVIAARLAQRGYEGPPTVLEGRFGVLEAFCKESDPSLLTKGLGENWEMQRLCVKRYACHVTSHVPVQLLRGFIEREGFSGDDIAAIVVDASDKVVSHHSEVSPGDIMQAQYSVPFNLALAAFHDPRDPDVYSDRTAAEPRIRDLARRVSVGSTGGRKGWSAQIVVSLHDGRRFEDAADTFLGCPQTPLSDEQLQFKFDRLCKDGSPELRGSLFEALMRIEALPSVTALPAT
jgi:2-methylcitrate dehydratase PrpD